MPQDPVIPPRGGTPAAEPAKRIWQTPLLETLPIDQTRMNGGDGGDGNNSSS